MWVELSIATPVLKTTPLCDGKVTKDLVNGKEKGQTCHKLTLDPKPLNTVSQTLKRKRGNWSFCPLFLCFLFSYLPLSNQVKLIQWELSASALPLLALQRGIAHVIGCASSAKPAPRTSGFGRTPATRLPSPQGRRPLRCPVELGQLPEAGPPVRQEVEALLWVWRGRLQGAQRSGHRAVSLKHVRLQGVEGRRPQVHVGLIQLG